ncbi:hypothetical protein [Alloprevotella tannerae]|uniref:hypothetical protein n=1 Tax=Alloprevotella tannerae TaxID=76122 RepID=UPI0028D73DD1|nr:hypothetical protein [Alloprevotella tannerae]
MKNNPLLGLLLKLFLRKKKNCLSRIGVIKSNNKRRRQKQPQQEKSKINFAIGRQLSTSYVVKKRTRQALLNLANKLVKEE